MSNTKDITQTGPRALRGIRNSDLYPVEVSSSLQEAVNNLQYRAANRNYETSIGHIGYSALSNTPNLYKPEIDPNLDFGSSMYDDRILVNADQEDINDLRAQNQPWYAQLGAGLAKGAILAGTTFLDGTVGLLFGLGSAIGEGEFSNVWNNDFSKAMQAINKGAEELMPNYYSTNELNSPWYTNILTPNFIGDKFIKNLGFAVGAMYSGSAITKVSKIPQLVGAITKSAKATKMVATGLGATTSAFNEGRIEALNNSKDWQNLKTQELDDSWGSMLAEKYQPLFSDLDKEAQEAIQEYNATKGKTAQRVLTDTGISFVDPALQKFQAKMASIEKRRASLNNSMQSEFDNRASDPRYKNTLNKIEEDKLKMGNVDLLFNMPILLASNLVSLTKFYGRGFDTARRAGVNVVKNQVTGATEYVGKSFSKGRLAYNVTKGAVAEGTEEISQKAASLIAGDYYSTDINNFYKAQMDPDAEQETLSWAKSFANGINETINDGSSWEEFFIGGVTGLLGIPSFRGIKNSNGNIQSPIVMQGGAFNAYRDYRAEIERSQEIASYLNQRVQSPEFLNYYRGLIRHNKYQKDMNKAVEDDDEFNFKNAEHAQFISDIIMFDNAGRLSDLNAFIEEAYDVSDENLQSIIDNTTSTINEDDKEVKIGPFVDKNGNPMTDTESGKEEMIAKLTQSRDSMLETLKNYKKTKNEIDLRTNGHLSNDQLAEMTWLQTQVNDWTKRANQMTPIIKKALIDISNNLESNLVRAVSSASVGENENTSEEVIKGIGEIADEQGLGADRIKQLRELSLLDNKELVAILTNPKNVKFVESLIEDISIFGSDIIGSLDKQNVVRMLKDLPKIGKGIDTYNKKFEEYLTDPSKLEADQAKATEQLKKEVKDKKSTNLRTNLTSAKSVAQFREAFDQEEDAELKNGILNDLLSEENEVAKNYKEISQYDSELKTAISELGEDPQTSQDALALWNEQLNNAERLEQAANPNSVYINNEEAFITDSNGDVDIAENRFQAARYTLQRAMSKVNNDIKFKNRFSKEYKKAASDNTKSKGKSKEAAKKGTTSTTSPTGNPKTPIDPSNPIGDITASEVAEENKGANKNIATQRDLDKGQKGQRKYYRPVIPELHIEASKEGDFRPFDVVVGEREQGVDFSEIYNYLRDNGAFNYVNAAKLRPGDTLGFMIDPEFNDHTIFLVDTRNNQIVGSIDESEVSVSRYEGLENLIKRVRDEYQKSRSNTQPISTNTITSKTGRVRTTEVYEVSRTTDEEGTVKVELEEKIASDSEKPSLVGRTILTGGLGISLDSDIIDWKRQASGGRREDGSIVLPEEVTPEEEQEAKQQIKEFLDEANPDQLYISTIKYTKDGLIVAYTKKGLALFLNSDPIKGKNTFTKSISRFFATPQVRVSKVMVGRIPYTNEERSLADTPGVVNEESAPLFGIIKRGTITTNGKIDDRLIIKPVDMANKEGRLYLLIPNAAGTYSPAAVRVKHFNSQEFNIEDATVSNTAIGKSINNAIDKLTNASSQEDVTLAMKSLVSNIYLQDVMISWFDADAGSGIVISKKVRKPDGTYETVTIDGKEHIKEEKASIYFQSNKKSIEHNGITLTRQVAETSVKEGTLNASILDQFGQPKDIADIRKEILNALYKYNLPLQVNASDINNPGYNSRLIESNILTSNLREAKVIGSWFTTDYFDNQGNLQKAISPASVKPAPGRKVTTPVGGNESVIQGTRVLISGVPYIVNLKDKVAMNEKTGEQRAFSAFNSQSLIDMAWAQETFGDATESSQMTDNKVITPQGRVLDRNTGHYLSDEEAQKIKDKLSGKTQTEDAKISQSKRVIAEIQENQKKVDKERTDNTYYYILEEDGQYHQYLRVHSRLGDNWLGEKTESENSKKALKAGNTIDKIIREFFTSKEVPVRPENISEEAFNSLISRLTEIKSKMEQLGETFMANNIVLFQKYPDGTRIAGEVDILSVDKKGNFKIYDIKTSKYSFSSRYFNEKSSMQRMSTKDYYTLQLSAYQNLFESQYNVRPVRLAIMPFVLTYDDNGISSIVNEAGIPITYNSAVNVPIVSTVQVSQQQETLPIFDPTIETMNPENRVLPENAFEEGGEIGYYDKDGKLYTGYLKKIGEVEVTYGSGQKEKVPIYSTKVRDRGFGREGEMGSTSEYLTVFPNGKAISTGTNSNSDKEAFNVIMKALSAKPEKVLSLSNEKTKVYNPRELEELEIAQRNNQYSSNTPQTNSASKTIQKEDAINKKPAKRTRHKLRAVDNNKPTWNIDKELAWLKRVLPQLSEQDRIKVVKGLIQVSENGPVAWGMFSDGIVTLSDIAAEGTSYHEAFHVVFNLMLNSSERESLFEEARQLFGNKSLLELEEDMAEGFREYVMSQENRSFGRKILDFFKNLFAKVTNWKYIKPSLYSYYRMINQGKYKNTGLKEEKYTSEMQSIKEQAIADGTFMKAPNGNPTNLTERQWLQVRTKNFIDWFGDWINNPAEASKVVDENGEPLVVYHGNRTKNNITAFDVSKINSEHKTAIQGFWFITDEDLAKNVYALKPESIGKGTEFLQYGETLSVFLSIKNPIIEEQQGIHLEYTPYGNFTYAKEQLNNFFNRIKIKQTENTDGYIVTVVDTDNRTDDFQSKQIQIIALNPNQVKSATDNTGEFNTNDNDIRYRIADNTISQMRKETQRFLDNFGITIKEASEFEDGDLFDALNRVINIRSAEDISEGVGYAIAFMMQHNDMMNTLIKYKIQLSPKGAKRSFKNRGDYDAMTSLKGLLPEVKQRFIREIGSDIASELRKLYNLEHTEIKSKSFLSELWNLIKEFYKLLTPAARNKFYIIRNYTKNIANSVKLNDPSIILTTDYKPGTTEKAARVNIGKALKENPYERGVIELLNSKGIALAGSASIALEGTLYRPSKNPLHDLDFNAGTYTKESLNSLIKELFPNHKFIREIIDGKEKFTETYLVLNRPFELKKSTIDPEETIIYDKETGKELGHIDKKSELHLEDGIKGKFLDFFLGKGNNKYPYKVHNINGKSYLVSDFRNALDAKIAWVRPKDIWDYNRFNFPDTFERIKEERAKQKELIRKKLQDAKIIWGHPAIGKTTYLERNKDIIEWDEEVNSKREKFIRDQIDPEHKLNTDSKEYTTLKKEYMKEWKNHPEYIEFLTSEWEKLKAKAARENKRIFASPYPLLEIGRDDFDLFINLPEKEFLERNMQRGGSNLGSIGWKQAINENLLNVDPDKIITTDKYFSEFMRENLGVQWGTLTEEEINMLTKRGWTEAEFNRISQEERDHAVECAAV